MSSHSAPARFEREKVPSRRAFWDIDPVIPRGKIVSVTLFPAERSCPSRYSRDSSRFCFKVLVLSPASGNSRRERKQLTIPPDDAETRTFPRTMISLSWRKIAESGVKSFPVARKCKSRGPHWPERGLSAGHVRTGIDRACPCPAEYAMREISIFRPRRATLSVDTGYHDNTPLPSPSADACNESAAVARENGRLRSSCFSSSLLRVRSGKSGARARARERDRQILHDDAPRR